MTWPQNSREFSLTHLRRRAVATSGRMQSLGINTSHAATTSLVSMTTIDASRPDRDQDDGCVELTLSAWKQKKKTPSTPIVVSNGPTTNMTSGQASTKPTTTTISSSSTAVSPNPLPSKITEEKFDFGPTFTGAQISATLKRYFGHTYPRRTQARAISSILRGRDCFVLAPTGGGKSMCYQLPALLYAENEPGLVTLIVSPLIALMQDQVAYLKQRGIPACLLGSACTAAEKKIIHADLNRRNSSDTSDHLPASETHDFDGIPRLPEKRIAMVFISPEYLNGDVGRGILAHLIAEKRINFIAIDECHCISSWGHSFRPSFRSLSFLKQTYPTLPLMLLTATATKKVQKDIIKCLHLDPTQLDLIQASFNRPEICYSVQMKESIKILEGEDMNVYKHIKKYIDECSLLVPNSSAASKTAATPSLPSTSSNPWTKASTAASSSNKNATTPGCCGIIYVGTQKECTELADELKKLTVVAAAYHAGIPQSERTKIQDVWMKNQIHVIVATIAFGMGINKPDVRFVIHYQLSPSMEAYYQESGRCGRDHLPSNARIYYSQSDLHRAKFLIQHEKDEKPGDKPGSSRPSSQIQSEASMEHKLLMLESMMQYCEATTCRRQKILEYFGEKLDTTSDVIKKLRATKRCCDVCSDRERVESSLNLAKSVGNERVSGAGMSGMKSGWVYDGPRSGMDPYESYEEHQLTEKQLERKKQEEIDASVPIPKSILLNKEKDFHKLMDYMEAAEAKEDRARGIERKVVRTPFGQTAAASRGVKRPRPYTGALLGVNGTHTIADLPTSKREDSLAALTSKLKSNRSFEGNSSDSASSAPVVAPKSVTSVSAALEYLTFIQSRTSAIYLTKMRAHLGNIVTATKQHKEWTDWKSMIDWNKIPTESPQDEEEESSSSDSDSDENDSDAEDEEDEDAPILPKVFAKHSSSSSSSSAGGFQSASSLVGPKAGHSSSGGFGSKVSTSSLSSSKSLAPKSDAITFNRKPSMFEISTAAKLLTAAKSVTDDRVPMRGNKYRKIEAELAATATPAPSSGKKTKKEESSTYSSLPLAPLEYAQPYVHLVVGTKPLPPKPASSTTTTPPRSNPPPPSSSTTASSTYMTDITDDEFMAAYLKPSVDSIEDTCGPTTPSRPNKYRGGGTLNLTWAHSSSSPVNKSGAGGSGSKISPSRIAPLTLTTTTATPPSSSEKEKRPRAILQLTTSSPPPSKSTIPSGMK